MDFSNVTLSPSQQLACDAFAEFLCDPNEKEFLLSGFAGSGKTFLVNYLVDQAYKEHELARLIKPTIPPITFHFSAYTNKAAAVLHEATGAETKTIHQTLNLTLKSLPNGKQKLVPGRRGPVNLFHSVLVIDEASMIDRELLQFIQEYAAKERTCKILYVGDMYQLPPVKEDVCPIFFATQNTYFLTDIQRQAAQSPIIALSHKFREILDDETLPWPVLESNGPDIVHYDSGKEWEAEIERTFVDQDADPDKVRILGWTNKRVVEYNRFVDTKRGKKGWFEDGEMLINNDPIIFGMDAKVAINTGTTVKLISHKATSISGVEGHELKIEKWDSGQQYTVFQPKFETDKRRLVGQLFGQKKHSEAWAIKNEWADLRAPHAQTVHKSQGSTYDKVFIDVTDISKNNKWYEVARLMYVAITRAAKEVHLIGQLPERYNRVQSAAGALARLTTDAEIPPQSAQA